MCWWNTGIRVFLKGLAKPEPWRPMPSPPLPSPPLWSSWTLRGTQQCASGPALAQWRPTLLRSPTFCPLQEWAESWSGQAFSFSELGDAAYPIFFCIILYFILNFFSFLCTTVSGNLLFCFFLFLILLKLIWSPIMSKKQAVATTQWLVLREHEATSAGGKKKQTNPCQCQ